MYRIEETAAKSIKGSFALLAGNSISLIVNAIGIVLVARMLSPSEYGLFTVIMVLPSFFSLFTNWGIEQALINFIARYRSRDDSQKIKNLIRTGYVFKFLIGSTLTALLYLSAELLLTTVLKRPEIVRYVRIASLFVFAITTYDITLAILTGFERMDSRASLNIIQSLIKSILSSLLVYLGYGVLGVVTGHIVSYILAATIGFLTVVSLTKSLPEDQGYPPLSQNLKLMLEYGLPLFIGTILIGLTSSFNGFLLSWFIEDKIIGNYSIAILFVSLVGVVTISMGITFFPAFSKYDFYHEPKKTEDIYKGSIRYSSIFIIPFVCLLITLSKQIIGSLFGAKYPYAPLYLSLLLTPSLLVGIGSLSIERFLNSQGETKATMIILSLGSFLKIILALLFIRQWGMVGLLSSFIVSDTAQNLLGLLILGKKYGMRPDLGHTWKILICSIISGGISISFQILLPFQHSIINLVVNASVYMITFLLLAPFIGVLESKDIHNLYSMFNNLPLVYPLANIILSLEARLLNMRARKNLK